MISTPLGANPCVAFDPSAKVFALGMKGSIRLYSIQDMTNGPFLAQNVIDGVLLTNQPEWTKIEFSNDGKYILVSTRGNVLYLLDAFEGKLLHRLVGHINPMGISLQGCFTPDAKYVLCGKCNSC
jgi:COMPASS component SWD2